MLKDCTLCTFIVFVLLTNTLASSFDEHYEHLVKIGHEQAMENLVGSTNSADSKSFTKTMGTQRDKPKRKSYLAQDYEPIRISMNYDNMDNCTEDQKEYLITRVFVPLRDKL